MRRKTSAQGIGSRILKAIGILTAVISLVLGIRQIVNIIQENAERHKESARLVAEAERQASSGEYSEAWKNAARAADLDPDRRDVQVTIGMEWLRNLHVTSARGEKSFTEVVEKVSPALYQAIDTTRKTYAATVLAHIGWADYLLFRDGDQRVRVDDQFREALRLDSTNVYAHAMLGFWILFPGHDGGSLRQANEQFYAALRAGKETGYVRDLMIAAYDNAQTAESEAQIIKVANDMRKKNEQLDLSTRKRIMSGAYFMYRDEIMNEVGKLLSPAEHLETFLFLMEGMDVSDKPFITEALARVRKAAGANVAAEKAKH